jgi:peptidyl-dipeptidase Dcp
MGQPTYSHFALKDSMARTPQRAYALVRDVLTRCLPAVRRQVEELKSEFGVADIQPWDYWFYLEKLRVKKFSLDQSQVSQYLKLENVRDGAFEAAWRLYGVHFERVDVSVPNPDVSAFKVLDEDGSVIGILYIDPYARTGKQSGAWMTRWRSQHGLGRDGRIPLVVNCLNFMKPNPGEVCLISWDDATTVFHEFGHALHGLLSWVKYPSQSGTSVVRDYVEFPSQIMEHWLSCPETLQDYATHYKTGESMPKELRDALKAARTFDKPFDTLMYLLSTVLDLEVHMSYDGTDLEAFQAEVLRGLDPPKEVGPRHRLPHFSHIFSSGYSSCYYSYLWADVLAADGFSAFPEDSPFDLGVADRLLKNVLSVGDSIDPNEGYRQFRGRDPDPQALLIERGLL